MSFKLTPSLGKNLPLPPGQQDSLGTHPALRPGEGELCALLGPLVSPLLQNAEGGLDLTKLPVASFEDFRSFLITQVRVDGIAFNEVWLDSYHAVLADDRHEPLLRSLYAATLSASGSDGGSVPGEATELESHGVGLASVKGFESSREDGTSVVGARGGLGRSPSPGEGAATPVLPRGQGAELKDSITKDQLHAFTADLIKVSGERFAGNHLRTKEGRARLSNILLDSKNYSHDLRSDLVKGIALGGRSFGTSREAYRRLNQEISVWNYTNTAVTKDELSRATHITLDILQEVASQQEENQDLLLRYLKRPQDVTRFSGLEKELQRTISDDAIQANAEYIDWNRDNYDPKIALGVKLDELWLTLIDDGRWKQSGSLKTAKNAAFVLKEVESLREKLNEANSEVEFLEINEGIRTLLKGGIGVKGKGTLRSLKDFTASSTVVGMFKDLPEVHRQSYDNLLQYSEELHYAKEMGETITLGQTTAPSPPKGPERSTGKAGAVAGGEVREPTGGTSLAPGPQARGSLAPQVELAGSQKADLYPHVEFARSPKAKLNPQVDLASMPKADLSSPTDLALLPKVDLLPKADEARTPKADASPSVIPAQFHPGQAFPNQDPVKKQKADPKKLAAEEAKRFTEAKSQFIHGLKQTKRSLWYQYKQHKALSRGISQTAKLFNKGDIQEIEAGQAALDKIIQQVEATQDESQLKSQIQALQTQLKEDGPVHLAMVAAEMDGNEQLIGLGQTILIILATRQLGRGMARLSTAIAETQTGQRLANLAQQLRQHQLGQSIHRGMQNNVFAWRATKGFAMGAWISTAENGIAAATDEVHPEGHHAKSWAFDALATGVAMGIFTTAASYMGNSIEKNLLKRMMGRYFGNTKAPLHIIGDVIAEMGEETIDATLRAKLEDGDKALGFDQFREIAMVSGLGGFTKTGMIAEMLRSPKAKTPEVAPVPEERPARTRKTASMSLRMPPIVKPDYRVDQRGPLGVFLQEKIAGVKAYTPLGYINDRPKSITNPQAPLAIMITGAGGDQSHYGELPQQLFQAGYHVSNLVIPGYDASDASEILKVGFGDAQGLADYWYQSLKQATETVMDRHPQSPVVLLGQSLGAASLTRILTELSEQKQERVKAMVLAAPAFAFHPFESDSVAKNWFMRHVAFPLRVLLSPFPKKARQPMWDPEVADHVYTIPLRPWGSDYAAVLYGETAATQLSKVKSLSEVPPTLILFDEQDPTVAPRGAKLVAKAFGKRAVLKPLQNTDHYPFLTKERQKLFNQIKLFFHGTLVGDSLDHRRTMIGGFSKNLDSNKSGPNK